MDWLGQNSNRLPKFIVLDLNMPKMDGIEFLREIKKDSRLKKIPVIVFTTSQNPNDIQATFENQVAGYMIKHFDYQKYLNTIRNIKNYWETSYLGHV